MSERPNNDKRLPADESGNEELSQSLPERNDTFKDENEASSEELERSEEGREKHPESNRDEVFPSGSYDSAIDDDEPESAEEEESMEQDPGDVMQTDGYAPRINTNSRGPSLSRTRRPVSNRDTRLPTAPPTHRRLEMPPPDLGDFVRPRQPNSPMFLLPSDSSSSDSSSSSLDIEQMCEELRNSRDDDEDLYTSVFLPTSESNNVSSSQDDGPRHFVKKPSIMNSPTDPSDSSQTAYPQARRPGGWSAKDKSMFKSSADSFSRNGLLSGNDEETATVAGRMRAGMAHMGKLVTGNRSDHRSFGATFEQASSSEEDRNIVLERGFLRQRAIKETEERAERNAGSSGSNGATMPVQREIRPASADSFFPIERTPELERDRFLADENRFKPDIDTRRNGITEFEGEQLPQSDGIVTPRNERQHDQLYLWMVQNLRLDESSASLLPTNATQEEVKPEFGVHNINKNKYKQGKKVFGSRQSCRRPNSGGRGGGNRRGRGGSSQGLSV